MTKAKQDDLSRRRRLNNGCCPQHGIPLVQIGLDMQPGKPVNDYVACPRGDCLFRASVHPNSKLARALRGT